MTIFQGLHTRKQRSIIIGDNDMSGEYMKNLKKKSFKITELML